jgi:hypothetical protein
MYNKSMNNLKELLKSKIALILEEARASKKDWRELIGFEVSINNVVYKNIGGGYNGNPWDCWLVKKGTLGKSKNTFIRIYAK